MTNFKALTITAAALAFASGQVASAAATPKPELWNGTWHLNAAHSKFSDPNTAEKSETRIYHISGSHVTMRSTVVRPNGKSMHWGYAAVTDGKWYLTSGNPAFDHIGLTAPTDREMKADTRKNKEPAGKATLTVSAGGKELRIDRANGNAQDLLVFDRAK
jgi:hypothetical protein